MCSASFAAVPPLATSPLRVRLVRALGTGDAERGEARGKYDDRRERGTPNGSAARRVGEQRGDE